MLQQLARDRRCWLEHMKLNETTWEDPDGIRLRAVLGLGAADYFMKGMGEYYLWGPLIENLADVGYDEQSIFLAAYDWRLPFAALESRDGFFSSLKARVELMVARAALDSSSPRAVVVSHSMGSPVWLYFMQWVERKEEGELRD